MINILLVEDHNIVRDGIRSLLLNEPDFQIAGEVATGSEALEKLASGLKVSVILTDINSSTQDGFDFVRKMRDQFPQVKVIIITMLEDEVYIQKAFSNGATGYLLKTVGISELFFAIRHVSDGNSHLASSLSLKLLEKNRGFYTANANVNSKANLSPREVEVLKMVGQGLTNNEIAEKIFTSKRTVEGHRQKLLNKTGTKNTAALIRYAIQHKILN